MNISDARQETDSQAAYDAPGGAGGSSSQASTAGGAGGSSPRASTAPERTPGEPSISSQPPLVRPLYDRMLAGVAAGVADYLGVDPTIARIVLAVLVFVGGAGIPIYLAGWLLIPEEGAERSIASDLIGSFQSRSY